MKTISIDPAANRKAIIDFLSQQQSFYAGILDKVPDAFKADMQKLKAGIDEKLATLASAPTDQVPAAQQAAYGLENMAQALNWMQEMYTSAVNGLSDLMERVTPKEQALHAFETRIASGELIEKAAAEEATKVAVQAAVDEAVKAERAQAAMFASRRQMLASANLPIPADESVIAGEETDFDARRKAAKERHEKLNALGVCQQLESSEIAELIYGSEKEWTRFTKIAGRGRQVAEPLAGGTSETKPLRGY